MPGFLKSHADAATAAEAIRRSGALRAAGVATPAARAGPECEAVEFDQIDGVTGPALLCLDLAELLSPLARLHRAEVTAGLNDYDPFLRSRPRIALATQDTIRAVLNEPVPVGRNTLHGDFHIGQLIAQPNGKIWVVDLDDMAIGPPEADIANFVAHLATSATCAHFTATLARQRDRVLRTWQRLGATCNEAVFDQYLRFALVRRHLKLRQAGRTDFEAEILGVLSGATTRISPSGTLGYPG